MDKFNNASIIKFIHITSLLYKLKLKVNYVLPTNRNIQLLTKNTCQTHKFLNLNFPI